MAQLVTGLFNNRSSAMLAIEDLMRHGFAQDDISLLMTDTNVGREFFTDVTNKAPEGGVLGTIAGGIIGGIIAAIMNLGHTVDWGTGLVALPANFAVLVGVALGAIAGLIIGAIIGSTIPEFEMNLYGPGKRRGGILVGTYCHRRREVEVRRLMEAAGGHDLRSKTVSDDWLPARTPDYATASQDRNAD
jgi:hypothetical protein